jgi:hypothetical protein
MLRMNAFYGVRVLAFADYFTSDGAFRITENGEMIRV